MNELRELKEQAVLSNPRVDRDAGIIRHAHVLGIKSSNGYDYGIDGIKSATPKYEQMPVSIDHDYNSTPLKVEKVWGTLTNPVSDEQGVWADIHYLKSHSCTEQVLEDLERGTGLFSLSSVNGGVVQKGKVVTQFTPLRCDLVVKGATTKTLLEQTIEKPEEVIMENKVEETIINEEVKDESKEFTYEQYESLLTKFEEITATKSQLELRLEQLEARLEKFDKYMNPKMSLEQRIEQATKGIDLHKFWNDEDK